MKFQINRIYNKNNNNNNFKQINWNNKLTKNLSIKIKKWSWSSLKNSSNSNKKYNNKKYKMNNKIVNFNKQIILQILMCKIKKWLPKILKINKIYLIISYMLQQYIK